METFGLKYPIFEDPHGNQTCPKLCIAVANAGAMGALAAFIFDSEDTARKAHEGEVGDEGKLLCKLCSAV